MKVVIALAFAASLATPDLTAQDKVSVPLSNASQPVTVKVHLMHGSITVTPGPAGQVIVESSGMTRETRVPKDVPDLHDYLDAKAEETDQ